MYRPQVRSLAMPELLSAEILERLDDPETDEVAFHESCLGWAKQVLVPRRWAAKGSERTTLGPNSG
jgi:hypothetical protein